MHVSRLSHSTTILFVLLLSLLNAPTAWAAPAPAFQESRLLTRQQSKLSGPTEFKTVTETLTRAGLVTQTCDVVLRPVRIKGVDMVREDKACQIKVDPSRKADGSGGGGSEKGSNNAEPSEDDKNGKDIKNSKETEDGKDSKDSKDSKETSSSSESSSSTDTASATTTAETTASTTTDTAGAANTDPAAAGGGPISVVGPGVLPTDALGTPDPQKDQVSGTAAPAEAPSATPFQLPGKKLEVLPIGLGVFAGISVIALIVVGLVTYERTKYRKAFRQRKLAEQGAGMGYGGMAERA
jgi:hypothetical protein